MKGGGKLWDEEGGLTGIAPLPYLQGGNHIKAEGATRVAEAVGKLTSLQHLYLVSDRGEGRKASGVEEEREEDSEAEAESGEFWQGGRG